MNDEEADDPAFSEWIIRDLTLLDDSSKLERVKHSLKVTNGPADDTIIDDAAITTSPMQELSKYGTHRTYII